MKKKQMKYLLELTADRAELLEHYIKRLEKMLDSFQKNINLRDAQIVELNAEIKELKSKEWGAPE